MLEAVWKVPSLEANTVIHRAWEQVSLWVVRGLGMPHGAKRDREGGCSDSESKRSTRLKGVRVQGESGNSTSVRLESGKQRNKPMGGSEDLPGVSERQEQNNLGQRKG